MPSIPALCRRTAGELAHMLAHGHTTSAAIVEACLQAIEVRDGDVRAFIEVFAHEAREQAAQSDARRRAGHTLSPLDGVPLAVKDNIAIRGHVCSCAGRMLQNYVSPYDATVIQRVRAAGMPILGRLNMDEFAMGSTTENSALFATRNPCDPARVPGGSSGGAAAAVAACMTPLALGSDTGGSIRQPAALCGVLGAKPAYGAVSRYGLVAFASSLEQIGPIARCAADAAMLMDVIGGEDERDMTTDPSLAAPHAVQPGADVTGLRIAMPVECFGHELSASVRSVLLSAAERLRALGARVFDISIPALDGALPAYYILSAAEASSNLARYDGVRYGQAAHGAADPEELFCRTRSAHLGPEVQRRILLGTFALSSGYREDYYLRACRARDLLRAQTDAALTCADALLMPVSPDTAGLLGQKQGAQLYAGDLYTVPANLTGHAALSVPCGPAANGLPVGMGLTGASLPLLLRIATAFEAAREVQPL